ncbi:MAG: ROK family protein [Verrucomicrobiota bacterium]|jgi:predicted NBD/HSP70 family sugar kinase
MIFHPASMGLLNRRALIRQLQKTGLASRAGLARSLGMSQPTAGKIVDDLISEKILEEVESPEARGNGAVPLGRPGRQLRLNRSQPSFLGIQLGIQRTQLAELPLGATDDNDWQASFDLSSGVPKPAVDWERGLRVASKKLRARQFPCVLLSVPGVVDETAKRVLFSPNIHWIEGIDLPAIVRRVWDAPVLLVQEERPLALGHLVNNPRQEDFLLVDFGDGVGGAIIVGGKPLASSLPISGELGHTPVLGNRRKCGCGATGCVETLVSIRGLVESFSAAHPRKKSNWAALKEHISENGVEPWLAEGLNAAAVVIACSLNVLGLRRVVVTGALRELAPSVLEHLSGAIKKGAMWARFGEVECIAAPRRRTAGLVAVGIDRFIAPESAASSNNH